MVPTQTPQKAKQRAIIRSVALPTEHGGWGFLFEPILLGLLVAFSWQGILLALAAVGIFLIHQPLRSAIRDRLKGKHSERLVWAERFVVIYGLIAVIPMLILLSFASRQFLWPVVLAVPFALVQLYYDSQNQSRHAVPEIAGALALAMIAPAIALLGGWALWPAMVLWLILALRAVAAILYVRTRIRRRVGKPDNIAFPWTAHLSALTVAVGLALTGLAPWLTVLAFVVLTGRFVLGLSPSRQREPIKAIGFQELGYGLMTAVLVAVGYSLNL
ncbi:MAG: YwiC-like family protein [Chloroflexota bacterium]